MSTRRVGRLVTSGAVCEFRFNSVIQSADELIVHPEIDEFVSPGFVDVQVNGFAGVDYNDPSVSVDRIAQSLRTMFSTGVTRCFPTLITGSEERITGSLRNLVAAKRSLESDQQPEAAAIEAFHIEGPH